MNKLNNKFIVIQNLIHLMTRMNKMNNIKNSKDNNIGKKNNKNYLKIQIIFILIQMNKRIIMKTIDIDKNIN